MFNQIITVCALSLTILCTIKTSLAEDMRFAIDHFQVEGSSLLTKESVDEALREFTGPDRQFSDVQRALEALEGRYRQQGYGTVLVSIPEQELKDGVIRLKVVEPRLNNISVLYQDEKGSTYFSEDNVQAALPALSKGLPPNTPAIAENVQLANENPAKEVETVLSVDEEDPQLIDARIKVKTDPPHKVFMTFDNTGTEQSGEWRLGFGYQHANLFDSDHVLTLNYITPPEMAGDVNLYSLSYRLPLYALGDSIDFIAARSEVGTSTTQTVAGPLQFSGNGDVLGLHYNYLMPRWGEFTHRLTAGVDYRSLDNTCSLGSFGSAGCGPGAADVAMLPISLSYVGAWRPTGQSLDFYITALHNIPGVPNGDNVNFRAVRPAPNGDQGAIADYYAIRIGASFIQAVFGDWQVKLTGNAQYSDAPLVYAEQFGLVGSASVRGFWEREVTRDMGYAVNSEIYTPNLAKKIGYAQTFHVVAFFDHGAGQNNALAGESGQGIALTSVGFGLRFGFSHSVQVKFDGAYVLDGASYHSDGDARAHISLYLPFSF